MESFRECFLKNPAHFLKRVGQKLLWLTFFRMTDSSYNKGAISRIMRPKSLTKIFSFAILSIVTC